MPVIRKKEFGPVKHIISIPLTTLAEKKATLINYSNSIHQFYHKVLLLLQKVSYNGYDQQLLLA